MDDDNHTEQPRKRQRLSPPSPSLANSTNSTSSSSNAIDLTEQTPEPETSHPSSTTHKSLPDPAMGIQEDEAFARAVEAQLNNENGPPGRTNDMWSWAKDQAQPMNGTAEDPDLAYARQLQAQFNQEHEDIISQPSAPSAGNTYGNPPPLPRSTAASGPHPSTSIHNSSEQALQPKQVEQNVLQLSKCIARLRCDTCLEHIMKSQGDVTTFAQIVLDNAGHLPGLTCSKCRAITVTEQDRLTMIWAVLCAFDTNSKHNKVEEKKKPVEPPKPTKPTKPTPGHFSRASRQPSGTGYGSDRSDTPPYGSGFSAFGHAPFEDAYAVAYGAPRTLGSSGGPQNVGQQLAQKPLEPDDKMTAQVMSALTVLLPSYENHSAFDSNPPAGQLQSILLCSSILDRAADLLRNNSLDDVTRQAALYMVLIPFVQTLAKHLSTSALVFGERMIRKPGSNLLTISFGKASLDNSKGCETTQSLMKCLPGLAAQCCTMLRSQSSGEHNMKRRSQDSDHQEAHLFRSIKELNEFLTANGGTEQSTEGSDDSWMKELAVADVADDVILGCFSLHPKATVRSTILPGRMKRIMQEIAILQSSLPDGIFVRYAESRPDLIKVLMIGPKGTPYENGLFEFDLLCDADFPTGPPKMSFRTTGGGIVRFNPNLYPDGMVCLSLLGTWQGEPWQANKSTLLQVLVSIQAMIFCDDPWCNEPGQEALADDHSIKSYNIRLYPNTVRHAMLDWLERKHYAAGSRKSGRYRRRLGDEPSEASSEPEAGIWDEIVTKHFEAKAPEIIKTVDKWITDVPPPPKPRPTPNFFTPMGQMHPSNSTSTSMAASAGSPPPGLPGPQPPGIPAPNYLYQPPSAFDHYMNKFAGTGKTLGGGEPTNPAVPPNATPNPMSMIGFPQQSPPGLPVPPLPPGLQPFNPSNYSPSNFDHYLKGAKSALASKFAGTGSSGKTLGGSESTNAAGPPKATQNPPWTYEKYYNGPAAPTPTLPSLLGTGLKGQTLGSNALNDVPNPPTVSPAPLPYGHAGFGGHSAPLSAFGIPPGQSVLANADMIQKQVAALGGNFGSGKSAAGQALVPPMRRGRKSTQSSVSREPPTVIGGPATANLARHLREALTKFSNRRTGQYAEALDFDDDFDTAVHSDEDEA